MSPARHSTLGTQVSRLKTQDFYRAFTLVELIVVIGIIVILAGLLVSASVTFARKSEISQTETMLEQLTIILQEWELAVDRQLSLGTDGQPAAYPDSTYDLQTNTEAVFQVTELFNIVARPSTIRDMIGGIDADFIRTYRKDDPQPAWLDSSQFNTMKDDWAVDNTSGEQSLGLVILDRWDQPLRVIHPGHVWNDTVFPGDNLHDRDLDDTIRTEVEHILGIAVNRQLCFVSAGPDGKFGDLHIDIKPAMLSDAQQAERDLAMDNIYSYPIVTEEQK